MSDNKNLDSLSSPPQSAVDAAVEEACHSLCAKSKRGAAVYLLNRLDARILGSGHNSPPIQLRCDGSDECKANCGKYCQHAEARAINDMMQDQDYHFGDMALVHVKVACGKLIKGGGPSCWQCSKQILDIGLDGVWLYEDPDGWKYYSALQFHIDTLNHPKNNIKAVLQPLDADVWKLRTKED